MLRYVGKSAALVLSALIFTNLFIAKSAHASAFALREQSITYLGNAYAGTVSAAQDASTSYYNPAGMGVLDSSEVVLSGAYIVPNISILSTSATNSNGGAVTGTNPSKATAQMFVPGFNAALRLTDDFSLGLSVVEPFGINNRYAATDIVRYMSTDFKITTVDISPTIAYKIDPHLYIGAGLDFLLLDANIDSSVGWGNNLPESAGFVGNDMNGDLALGFHVGLLYKDECTKFGVAYFSRFASHLSGTVAFNQTVDFGSPSSVTSKLDLPDRITFGITQKFTKDWSVMAEGEWTHWSIIKQWAMNYNSTALPGFLSFYFDNSWRASLGTDYNIMPNWTIKAGYAYDQSPTTNTYRSAMLPDSNRQILGLGMKFRFGDSISITAAYAHTFFNNTYISDTGNKNALNSSPIDPNQSTLNAQVTSSADTYGLQLSWRF